jgi:hypothetical protein
MPELVVPQRLVAEEPRQEEKRRWHAREAAAPRARAQERQRAGFLDFAARVPITAANLAGRAFRALRGKLDVP